MTAKGKLLFLGTGASLGIPVIGCHCPVCRSTLKENKRTRSAALLQVGGSNILIDCGPDFRNQMLDFQVDGLDGLILTHSHHDHSSSIDDLRPFLFNRRGHLPFLGSQETIDDIKRRFAYMFQKPKVPQQYHQPFDFHYLEGSKGSVNFLDIAFRFVSYSQIGMRVDGLRTGNFAYITDIRDYEESIIDDLKGIDILVLSALKYTPSHMHLSVDEAVDFAEKVGAKHTWLTHISHELDHEKTDAYLPDNVRLAYDGLIIDVEVDFHSKENDDPAPK